MEVHQHFGDPSLVITYRHLLSHNLGVRDPLRIVALCDSDAFYAACEMVRLGTAEDTPLVVLQWDSIIAVNYPARKYGISRMSKVKDALQKCPHLQVVHVATYKEGAKEPGYWDDVDTKTHKVSLDYYRRESLKVAAKFKDLLPGCEIEKASIDEAFIDFTKRAKELILERHPYLANPPPEGLDSPLPPPPSISWDGIGHLIPSIDEGQLFEEGKPVEEMSVSWHDVALSISAELMQTARQEVLKTLGYSTSAGIARNKFLAKLSASDKKPNNQSILRNSVIPYYLKPLPFQKIRYLGGKLGMAIAKEYEASTDMQKSFGEQAIWVWEVLRGIDRSEVKEKTSQNKSMMASKNLPKPIVDAKDGYHWIRVLAAELALRLNDARKQDPRIWPKAIVLHARKGYEAARSKQAPFPFVRDLTVDIIANHGDRLWRELVGNAQSVHVSAVQLSFSGIEASEAGQRQIEDFLQGAKRTRVEDEASEGLSFTCSRCGKVIRQTDSIRSGEGSEADPLVKLRMEHDDFHYAQDLAKADNRMVLTPDSAGERPRPAKKKKENAERQGIERFFGRKASD
ncbi:DNA polymerase eta [Pluteus cervinus]|uniref:DNA polymerase eta n=1 Tax=Pluteus cervinus TaxID=181527 RepID=A0ACD3B585_9AGAR|nr:DNA polymerase eta [Pluteus cervinus]